MCTFLWHDPTWTSPVGIAFSGVAVKGRTNGLHDGITPVRQRNLPRSQQNCRQVAGLIYVEENGTKGVAASLKRRSPRGARANASPSRAGTGESYPTVNLGSVCLSLPACCIARRLNSRRLDINQGSLAPGLQAR